MTRSRASRAEWDRAGTGNCCIFVPSNSKRKRSGSSWRTPSLAVAPLLWKTCFIQKQATELFRRPRRSRWSSSEASGGSLMTGADLLNTLPPRVEDEVVVGGDEGEGDGEGSAKPLNVHFANAPPRDAPIFNGVLNAFLPLRIVLYGQKKVNTSPISD